MNTNGCLKVFLLWVIALVIWAVISLIFAFPCMWLWNNSLVQMFNLSEVGYWEMYFFMMLVRLLMPCNTNYNNN